MRKLYQDRKQVSTVNISIYVYMTPCFCHYALYKKKMFFFEYIIQFIWYVEQHCDMQDFTRIHTILELFFYCLQLLFLFKQSHQILMHIHWTAWYDCFRIWFSFFFLLCCDVLCLMSIYMSYHHVIKTCLVIIKIVEKEKKMIDSV